MNETPEQEIGRIIRERKLLDPAEIVDLENLIRDKEQSFGMGARFNLDHARQQDLLKKILNWIKA